MIGLEKVTGKIISEAESEAEKTIDAARKTCEKTRLDAESEIKGINDRTENEIQSEGSDIISRADSASVMKCRGIMLSAKSRALDNAFVLAEEKICALPDDEYLKMTVGFTREALSGAAPGSRCTISANERDISRFGTLICRLFTGMYPDIVFSLSDVPARVSGGFLLDFGLTDADCSVKTVVAQARPQLENEVCRILFDRSVKR